MAVHRNSIQVGWLRFVALGLCSGLIAIAGCEGSLPAVPAQPPPETPAPSSCDDDNPCTDDIVDPDGSCKNVPQVRACDDGDACTFDDRCDAAGQCGGTAITCTDEQAPCGARRSCNGTSQCAQSFPGSDTACTAAGIADGHCDGAGQCAASGPPATPPECVSDSCFKREIDAATGQCKIVQRYGREVYERFDEGWAYGYAKEGTAKLAFRAVAEDLTLYQLHAPGIHEKMLSEIPNEANNCHWCGCASACTFYGTDVKIHTSRTQLPGTVPLQRYVDGSVSHRESLRPIDGWYAEPQFHGFVCPLL